MPNFKTFEPQTLAALDDAHGDIRLVSGKKPPVKAWKPEVTPETPWAAVFRKPVVGETDNFEGAAHNEKAKAGGLRNLAKALIVGVSLDGKITVCMDRNDRKQVNEVRAAWDELRAKHSGAHMAAQEDIMELSDMSKDEEGKE